MDKQNTKRQSMANHKHTRRPTPPIKWKGSRKATDKAPSGVPGDAPVSQQVAGDS